MLEAQLGSCSWHASIARVQVTHLTALSIGMVQSLCNGTNMPVQHKAITPLCGFVVKSNKDNVVPDLPCWMTRHNAL